MTAKSIAATEGGLLSIGELARRSGVATATVRSWEIRHGFPRPVRGAGGHRRYQERDVALVTEVVRLRRVGLSVDAAIAASTTADVAAPIDSFFASLRTGHPELFPQVLTKSVLSALTSAMEDEYCARAVRPVIYGAFQHSRFYRQSQKRWQELARSAQSAVVFADFPRLRRPPGRPVEIPVAAGASLQREWALVCDAPTYAACVAGWELPATTDLADRDRRFETVWSLDPRVVRDASRVGAALAADAHLDPTLTPLDVPPPASGDLHRATALFARILSYTQIETSQNQSV